MTLNIILLQVAQVLQDSTTSVAGKTQAAVEAAKSLSPEKLNDLKHVNWSVLIDNIANQFINFALRLIVALIVLYLGKFIINKLNGIVRGIMLKRSVDPSLSTFLLSLMKITLMFVLIVSVIGILGIETSSFIAIFASAGVAIGMALSGTLQNFAGGVLLLLIKPYKVGDYIEFDKYKGTVREIQIFHTIITTYNNEKIIIPNGPLSTGTVNNFSAEGYHRVEWDVSIAYGDDVPATRKAILDILKADSRIIQEKPNEEAGQACAAPTVNVEALGNSSVALKVRAWTRIADYWGAFYDINESIYQRLPEAGVHFPFPQIDVHLKKN